MLGNHADMFMTAPMPTAITTQEQQAMNMEMPAPRPTTRVGANANFLPGIGEDPKGFMPGFGQYVSAPSYSGTAGLGMMENKGTMLLIGGGLLAAYFLFMRKGKGGGLFGGVRPAARGGARRK